jgi:hypothetical protein
MTLVRLVLYSCPILPNYHLMAGPKTKKYYGSPVRNRRATISLLSFMVLSFQLFPFGNIPVNVEF